MGVCAMQKKLAIHVVRQGAVLKAAYLIAAKRAKLFTPRAAFKISLDEILASPESTLHHCLKDNEKHDSKQGTLGKSAEGKDGKREAGDLCEPGTSFEVREAASEEELLAAAWMRADVYADGLPYTRFVDSYRKQFAEQEFGSLLKRTKAQTGRHLRCCCLVAVDPTALAASYPASDYVIGTLDVSLKQLMPGERIAGEETSEESVTFAGKRPVTKARKYVYISNVCVPERARRRGIAAQMMGAAALVVKEWGFSEVFCHVEVDNRGAQELYKKLGYEKYGEVVVQETVSGAHVSLRRTLLLRAELDML
ncbi:hypothetical protein KFL_000150510 [Klebsormidium nitens]|uniref:N-acetyltransferase domain-containing protein n=1 Tax=Klebsormidium nitens TaxID=105231 RepID=A0A1Y1HPU9_KLENI|nr:hypothetical protein KFL_000150510 [Klebsormidium nitens]|eukprot:GAQ78597.1 hypothetical protein KFL_000150510 [Klebsormidium nitens]